MKSEKFRRQILEASSILYHVLEFDTIEVKGK